MTTVFRADAEPARSRLDRLRHVMADALVPLDIRPAVGAAGITDWMRACQAGQVRVAEMSVTPGEVARTRALIRRSDPGLSKIDVVERGRLVVEQDGREAVLGPGDLSYVDFSRPSRWVSQAPVRGVAVTFPPALLPLRRGELAGLTAVRVPGDQGTGGLASAFTRQLPRYLGEAAATELARVSFIVVDLLAAALAARLGRGQVLPEQARQRALRQHINAFIERRLADPELSPGTIAAAHHISLRYLYKLFADQPAGVAGWIWQRRLERCRRDLLDPALRGRPASAVAARWGFRSAGHFSRMFRDSYGLPPGEYRLRFGGPGTA